MLGFAPLAAAMHAAYFGKARAIYDAELVEQLCTTPRESGPPIHCSTQQMAWACAVLFVVIVAVSFLPISI